LFKHSVLGGSRLFRAFRVVEKVDLYSIIQMGTTILGQENEFTSL